MASGNHLLIDGDILLYQVTQSCLQEADWGDDFVTTWIDFGEIKHLVQTMIENWQEKLNAPDYTICLSDYERNFRKELDPTYKEQRDGSKKPVGYVRAHEWIQGVHPCEKLPGLEADDVMGIRATDGSFARPIIVSDDKDMRQIPGELYVPRRKERVRTTIEAGLRYHMEQTLTGDRVDNYFGCPGVGPVRAAKALDGKAPSELWPAVVRCYVAAKQTPADAIHQARLAKILQSEDWNADRKEVRLWEPPVSIVDLERTTATQEMTTSTVQKQSTSSSEPKESSSKTGTKSSPKNSPTTPTMIKRGSLLR